MLNMISAETFTLSKLQLSWFWLLCWRCGNVRNYWRLYNHPPQCSCSLIHFHKSQKHKLIISCFSFVLVLFEIVGGKCLIIKLTLYFSSFYSSKNSWMYLKDFCWTKWSLEQYFRQIKIFCSSSNTFLGTVVTNMLSKFIQLMKLPRRFDYFEREGQSSCLFTLLGILTIP